MLKMKKMTKIAKKVRANAILKTLILKVSRACLKSLMTLKTCRHMLVFIVEFMILGVL